LCWANAVRDDCEASPNVFMTAQRFSTRYVGIVDVDWNIATIDFEKLSRKKWGLLVFS